MKKILLPIVMAFGSLGLTACHSSNPGFALSCQITGSLPNSNGSYGSATYTAKMLIIDDSDYGPAAAYLYSSGPSKEFVHRDLITRDSASDTQYVYTEDEGGIKRELSIQRDTLAVDMAPNPNNASGSCQMATKEEINKAISDSKEYEKESENSREKNLKKNKI